MTERPITFPKTGDDEWTNRETGVRIVKRHATAGGGYKVWDIWGNRLRVVATLSEAKAEGKAYIVNVVRPAIAAAYVEALAEHIDRASARAKAAGAPTWRARVARRDLGYGWLDSAAAEVARLDEYTAEVIAEAQLQATIEADHAEALAECTPDCESFGHAGCAVAASSPQAVEGLCLRTDPTHIPHMKAVTPECREVDEDTDDDNRVHWRGWCVAVYEDEGRNIAAQRRPQANDRDERSAQPSDEELYGCTKVGGDWHLPHPYEYDFAVIERRRAVGDDGSTRCGALRGDDRHAVPQVGDRVEWIGVEPVEGTVMDVEPSDVSIRWRNRETGETGSNHPTLGEFAGSWKVVGHERPAAPEAPTHFGDEYLLDACGTAPKGQGLQVAFVAKDVNCPACLGVIAGARADDDAKASLMPQVPADASDDEAWARYCAALPAPTDDEKQRALAEVASPYAVEIEQCRESFRVAARTIWHGRRTRTLTDSTYRTQRALMEAMRTCISTYRGLAREWARRELAAEQAR